jgi:hypothetical protein
MSLGLATVHEDRAWFPSLIRRGQEWLTYRLTPLSLPHPSVLFKTLAPAAR